MDRAERSAKELVVLIRRPPLGSLKGTEALRMAVGQSMTNRITVALVDEGVWLATHLQPEVVGGGDAAKHLGMLLRLKQRVWAEGASLSRQGLDTYQLLDGVEVVRRETIDMALLGADAVVVY